MSKLIDIQSIEIKGEKTKIVWQESSHYGNVDKRTLETKVEPHPDFFRSMRSLDSAQCVESELLHDEDEYIRHDIVRVDFKWELDEQVGEIVMSASITSNRRMNNSGEPMKIVSPMKSESETASFTLNSKTVEKLQAVLLEANLFIEGKRNDLFASEEVSK